MATLAAMKSRIASELDRTDQTSNIANAINDAIAWHERERFWFNESRDLTFTTIASQRIYTSSDASWIPEVIQVDAMFITIGGQNRDLGRSDPIELELLADNSVTVGQPSEWAYFASSIQLYPLPDAAYTVRAMAHYRLASLADGDSNAWTTEAEQLIRRTAKILLALDSTEDRDEAMSLDPIVRLYLDTLRAETSRRTSTGRIMATAF